MKKLCVISLLVSMLVVALAPGISALDRDWRKVELEKYVQADGDETGWSVDAIVDPPEPEEPDEQQVSTTRFAWLDLVFRIFVPDSFTSPKGSIRHETTR